jgi:hypothetical protein
VTAARGWALLTALGLSSAALGHFTLQAPASWMSQGAAGAPEKAPPCGNEGGGTASGTVTTYHPGDTVTVTVNEDIFHPGHYRVGLIPDDVNIIVPEPAVTVNGSDPCGSAAIESPAVFPVLADDLFDHTTAFTTPQTTTVTLPNDFTCKSCVLQVIEFMSQHPLNIPGGCFYHHCANVTIVLPDGGFLDSGFPMPDAGNPDAGPPDAGTPDSGNQGVDSRMPGTDSGSPGTDSGTPASDSGTGGPSPDAGLGGSATGGCSCSGGVAAIELAALLAALLAMRGLRRPQPGRARR